MRSKRAPQKKPRYTPRKAPTTKKLERRVTKLEHTEELKCRDYYDQSALTTLGLLHNLNQIPQGDDFNQRIGEEVAAKYVNLKLRFAKGPSASANEVRCILFWDIQTNGTGPIQATSVSPVTGLLDNATIVPTVISPHNYRTKNRYHVIMDKWLVLNPDSTGVNLTKMIKKNVKLSSAKIKYSDSGSTVASTVSRSLWLLVCANASGVTDVTPTISARFWYTDA